MSSTTIPRTILITGAGKGIGAATAREFSIRSAKDRKPLKLLLTSRTEKDLSTLKQQLTHAHCEVHTIAAELSNADAVEKICRFAQKATGPIDCLINNAGVGRFGDVNELTEQDFDYVMGTNLKGTFLLTQNVFQEMRNRRQGHLIFVTSTAAETPFEQSAIYCMSKYAQKGLVDVLRLYGRKSNIRITNIMPGPVLTPMWGEIDADTQEKMMRPEDIATLIVESYSLPHRASVEEIVIRPVTGDL